MALTRRKGGFLGIKKAVKSLYQTKKQTKHMYRLSKKRKLKRLQEAKDRYTRKFIQQRANIENAAMG
jgi:hypothetical protein